MSATNMKLFLLLGFSLLLYHEIEGITTHSVTGCSDSVAVLNCSNTEMINVERITYYNGTDCNQAVTDLQVCGQPVTGSDTEFIPYCNGRTTCNDTLSHSHCPGSKAAKVDYRCIPGNDVKDMCDTFIIDNTNRTFLSTPNFPLRSAFTDIISPCRCSIRGSSITSIHIQILELVLHTSHDGNKSKLEINYGNVTYKTESFKEVTNERLSTNSTSAEISLNHNGIWQYLWIEIEGVGMRVSCNNDTNAKNVTTSSLLPSSTTTTTITHPPQTADIKCQCQDKDTTISILAISLFVCVLIICITAIIIIVLLRRKILDWLRKPSEKASQTRLYGGPRESREGIRLYEVQDVMETVWY